MNIVVCDDEKTFGEKLIMQIQKIIYKSDYGDDDFNYRYFSSPKELIDYMHNNVIDILFLDISMPELNGFDIAQICMEYYTDICLIFISNFERQVYYSIRFSPFRFLCKSNYEKHLAEAVNAAVSKLLKENEYITISNYNNITTIKVSRIIYVEKEKQKNYLAIHCLNDTYRHRITIGRMIDMLSSSGFIKISAGQLLNMKYISKIEDCSIILTTGLVLNMSKQYRSVIKEAYIKYMRNR